MILRRRIHRRKNVFGRIVITTAILFIAFWITMEVQIRPIARAIVKNKAQILSSDIIDEVITEVICESGISYDDIVITTYNDKNEIQAITTDIVKVNEFKAKITAKIHEKLSEVKNQEVSVPVGNLLGIQLLEGRGFDVNFSISLTGSASANLSSSFTSAGINQTRHSIVIDIDADICVLNSSWTEDISVKTVAVIAETIIVGSVPDLYSDRKTEN